MNYDEAQEPKRIKELCDTIAGASSLLGEALFHIASEPHDIGNCRLLIERAKRILDAAKDDI